MRTTLTIDDDLAAILKRESSRKGIPFKVLVNDSLRKGLSSEQALPARKPFKVRPHSLGLKPGIDPNKLNQLVDELEVEDFLEREKKRNV